MSKSYREDRREDKKIKRIKRGSKTKSKQLIRNDIYSGTDRKDS